MGVSFNLPNCNTNWWGGGRWSAVYSLWTYIHRFLHLLGIASIDEEEVSLLSGSLVRIQSNRNGRGTLLLANHPDPLHPDEPIGWVKPDTCHRDHTFFYIHFDSSDTSNPDHARIATASPTQNGPRAWLVVDMKTGLLTLTVSESHATLFDVRCIKPTSVSIFFVCTAGSFLSVHPKTLRARVCADTVGNGETFVFNHVPLPPTLKGERDVTSPRDDTMAYAFLQTRTSMVRIQSKAFEWFVTSKPGSMISAAKGKDIGWDGFTLEYDSPSRLARLKDSRGFYLTLGDDLRSLIAMDKTELMDTEKEYRIQRENLMIETIGEDDCVVLRCRKGYLSAQRGGRLTLSQETIPGKRERFFLRLALPSMMDQSRPRLRLQKCGGGARQIEASVLVPSSVKIAYEILKDYDGFKTFISDASESKVLERRSATELTVLMVQCHTFLMLTIPMTMTLDVIENEEKGTVSMDLKSGLGVKEYKGRWQAVERPDGSCIIKCSLLAATSVPAPGFLVDGLISHATISTLEQLRIECGKRAAAEKLKNEHNKKLRRNFGVKKRCV